MTLIRALKYISIFSACVSAKKPVLECKTDCDYDADCAVGLLCSDMHEAELHHAGYDKQKAYCGNVGQRNYDVCYDPKQIGVKPKIPVKYTPLTPLRGLCQSDCDLDIDCAPGLWCADEHTNELIKAGFHPRFADCGTLNIASFYEVCFDPKILKPPGGGGDPHFRTYDGTKYSYHGQCDLLMARSRSFGEDVGLDLHIRTEIVTDWSLISNAALRIGEDVFELANDGSYYYNGARNVQLPLNLAGKYEVSMFIEQVVDTTRTHFSINLGDEYKKVSMNLFKGMISVRLDAVLDGTEGLLGIPNKVGLIGRDRETTVLDANSMGAEWQIRDDEPMLFHEVRAPQYPAQCVLPSVRSRRLREQDRSVAEKACAGMDDDFFDFCVQDVVATGNADLAHTFGYGF